MAQWSLFQAVTDFLGLFATCHGTQGIVSWLHVCLSVCLSPEMNEEAFEAMSVTCNCLWAQQHRTNYSGPGDMSTECVSPLSTVTGHYQVNSH